MEDVARPAPGLARDARSIRLAAGVWLLLGIALTVWFTRPDGGASLLDGRTARVAFRLPVETRLNVDANVGELNIVAISPDGGLVAYVAEEDSIQRLYLRRLDSQEVRTIPGSEDASCPFFSPDGGWI